MRQTGDGCVEASILCRYDRRKGDLFVLSWARVRRVCRGRFISVLLICGMGVPSILLLFLATRCGEIILVCMSLMFAFTSAVVTVQGFVGMFVVYRRLLKIVGFISRCEVLCVVYLCRGCAGYFAFCMPCDPCTCNCKCFCMGRMLVSSYRCCMLVSCVHPLHALRAAFC